MRIMLALAALALVPAGPASAEDAAPPAQAAARLTLDTPVETIMADAAGKKVLDAHLPGMDAHPSYSMIKGMSLRQIAPYSNGIMSPELLAKVEAGLAQVK